jgi:hypothetical protein
MMDQNLARAVQIGTSSLDSLESGPATHSANLRPYWPLASFSHILGILISFGGIRHPIDVSVAVGKGGWVETARAFLP